MKLKKLLTLSGGLMMLLPITSGLSSCADIREIKHDLEDVGQRIAVLEERCLKLNGCISSIQELVQATSVTDVSVVGDKYIITLSDGKKMTIAAGGLEYGEIPVITVDEDGYWMVDYKDESGPSYLTCNGEKVPSVGEDAETPVFSVDEAGYWMVDYGDGPSYVKGAGGNNVKASENYTESPDSMFKQVDYDEESGVLSMTLTGGKEVSLPVVPDFLFAVSNAEGIQKFAPEEKRTFPVTSKGVGNVMIQAPQSWNVALGETSVTVTAPPSTKVAADTDTDVVLIAQSAKGNLFSVSKIIVELQK